ncbi:hypothetical protein VTN96DRAFT_8493 [Rasamsonia emersonii]
MGPTKEPLLAKSIGPLLLAPGAICARPGSSKFDAPSKLPSLAWLAAQVGVKVKKAPKAKTQQLRLGPLGRVSSAAQQRSALSSGPAGQELRPASALSQ